MRFKDGMEIDTGGEYRVIKKEDGYYVVGHGVLIPVENRDEGKEIIKELRGEKA